MVILFFGPESGWITWLSFVNLNAVNGSGNSCLMPLTPIQRLLSGLIVPIIGMVQLFVIFAMEGLLWYLVHVRRMKCPHPALLYLVPNTRTLKTSPMRRTLLAYFISSCNRCACCLTPLFI
jgi:hypothetical protein